MRPNTSHYTPIIASDALSQSDASDVHDIIGSGQSLAVAMMKSENQLYEFKKELKSIKKSIKEYEHNFLASTGRKPGKADITQNAYMGTLRCLILANQYKIYNKLRKALEEYEPESIDDRNSSTDAALEKVNLLGEERTDSDTNFRVKTRPKSRIATGIMSNDTANIIPITPKKNSIVDVKVPEFTTFNDVIDDWNISPSSAGYQDFISKKKEIEDLKSPKKSFSKNGVLDIEVSPIYEDKKLAETEKEERKVSITSTASKKEVRFESTIKDAPSASPSDKPIPVAQRRSIIAGWSGEIEKANDTEIPKTEGKEKEKKSPSLKRDDGNSVISRSKDKVAVKASREDETLEKGLPELPQKEEKKEAAGSSNLYSQEENSREDDKEEEELNYATLSSANSSNEMIKHIPTDIDASKDENAGKNVAQIYSASIKPVLKIESVYWRLPKDQVLRCRIFRRSTLLEKAYPTFYLHNDIDNSFILSARKRKKTALTTYVISDSIEETSKNSSHYVGRLKGNFGRNTFVLCDARGYTQSNPDAPLKELACVQYTKNVLPRVLSVAIPNENLPENDGTFEPTDVVSDMKTKNNERWTQYRNKNPRWNETTQSHCLNFGGRVTLPSVKNLQLIGCDTQDDYIYMQFGRCGPDEFSLDVRWPMTPLEAFSIAISTFEAYDGQ